MGMERYGRALNNRIRDVMGLGNAGKWNPFYRDITRTELYGDDITYKRASDFLTDVSELEDWGCGLGGFKRFCRTPYIGIDGSKSAFADKIADLASYRSQADGILIRHVLEHDYRWRRILDNAVNSYRSKLCLVIFTPLGAKTAEIAYNHDYAVPDISFCEAEIVERFNDASWTAERNLRTHTQYGVEHVFYVTRDASQYV